jgi:hypothetical protein
MVVFTQPYSQAKIRQAFHEHFVNKGRWDIVAALEHIVLDPVVQDPDFVEFPEIEEVFVSVAIPEHAVEFLDATCRDPLIRRSCLQGLLSEAAETFKYTGAKFTGLVFKAVDEDTEPKTNGLNNCFFKTETTIEHDELKFRSPQEIAIYDELKKRDLLFFPNAAAVLGGANPKKREPDFLICNKGKWGVLEVMGDAYHHNAAKDHDRARLFKEHGVHCVEFFTAAECMSRPESVVDKFLSVLAQH